MKRQRTWTSGQARRTIIDLGQRIEFKIWERLRGKARQEPVPRGLVGSFLVIRMFNTILHCCHQVCPSRPFMPLMTSSLSFGSLTSFHSIHDGRLKGFEGRIVERRQEVKIDATKFPYGHDCTKGYKRANERDVVTTNST